jgi:hypothetical protein
VNDEPDELETSDRPGVEPDQPSAADPGPSASAPSSPTAPAGTDVPALPSVGARLIGFAAIILAGAAGGFIGYAVTDLQCTGDCTTAKGIGGLVGATIVAVGVAIVVQLALRAMSEWRTIQARGGPEAERQRQRAIERRLPPETRPRPRVR